MRCINYNGGHSNGSGSQVRHYSILEYARFRWFKVSLVLCVGAGAAYLWHDPVPHAYGGTGLGYALGTIGALLIAWLLWFGVRKRSYSATGNLQGWLSAHVYLGTALLVIVTLHTGFQLAWNIHTIAYLLMVAVVVSGFYGVFAYLRVPRVMTANLGDDSLDSLVLRIADLDREVRDKGLSLPDSLFALVERSVTGTRLGGSVRRLLSGRDDTCPTAAALSEWPRQASLLKGEAAARGKEVYGLLLEKEQLLTRARRDLRYQAILDLWLYIHVPLAFMLLAALIAHIVSVFLYW